MSLGRGDHGSVWVSFGQKSTSKRPCWWNYYSQTTDNGQFIGRFTALRRRRQWNNKTEGSEREMENQNKKREEEDGLKIGGLKLKKGRRSRM